MAQGGMFSNVLCGSCTFSTGISYHLGVASAVFLFLMSVVALLLWFAVDYTDKLKQDGTLGVFFLQFC